MIAEGSALAAGVAELLRARREPRLAALVERSSVELLGEAERWSMGSREVRAVRVVLVVSADDHVALGADPARLEAVRDAFSAALRTPETELESLTLVLALPPTKQGFHRQGYRDAPLRAAEPPPAEAVLAGASLLCEARGARDAAAILSRAAIESSIAVANRSMRRFLVRLDAADLARVERDPRLSDGLASAIRDAAATAEDPASAVHFGLRLDGGTPLPEGEEQSIVEELTRKGVAVIPVARLAGSTILAAVGGGGIVLVEVAAGSRGEKQGSEKIPRLRIPAAASAEEADALSARIVALLGAGRIG